MENLKENVSRMAVKMVTSTPFTVVKMIFLGLGLYYLDMMLDGKLGIGYLRERNCHPKLSTLTIPDVRLSNFYTKDLQFNYLEFEKRKYNTAFMGLWGNEAVTPFVWFGDEKSRIKIDIFPPKPYMTHIVSSLLHVFDGDVVLNFGKVCSLNGASFSRQPDELFLTFCSRSMNKDSIRTFRDIFKGLNSNEKQLFFKLLTACNVPAVIDAIAKSSFSNTELQKCIVEIGNENSLSFLLKLYSLQGNINDFIEKAGLDAGANWNMNVYNFFEKCWKDNITIECNNKYIDDCPSGRLQYGTLTLLVIFFPGILFAISEFSHHNYFRFGGYAETKEFGKHWPLVLKWIMIPIYASLMAPFLIVMTTVE